MNAATSSWKPTYWVTLSRGHQSSLKKTIQAYKSLAGKLKAKRDQLSRKKEELESRAFIILEENLTNSSEDQTTPRPRPPSLELTPPVEPHPLDGSSPPPPPPPSTASISRRRMEENEFYHMDNSIKSKATSILLESVELRLSYVLDTITHLVQCQRDNPKQRTPPSLMLSRYEEWLQTNQRLFELNSQLYDLEKSKFDQQRREFLAKQPIHKSDLDSIGSQLVQSNALKIQSLLSRYQFSSPTSSTTQAYLLEVLTHRADRVTLEAQKVQEFVNGCAQNNQADLNSVTGAHPQSYQEFMGVLCNFIVERQREIQGEYLQHNMVYSTIEHIIIPQIQSTILRYVEERERDVKISEQCTTFADITLDQLSVKPAYQSAELEPFIDAIAQLRATYFTPTPTDKMSAIVSSAKALYDQLSRMGEDSIDGDSFLDLWVYVIIKANIPQLATNVGFMLEYSNPSFGMDEAGYYLTVLNVAANFIETLSEEKLKKLNCPDSFVVCEKDKFLCLSEMKGSCFQVTSSREELCGYKVAVVKDWVLNKARLFCTALLHTGDTSDVAVVSIIRISSKSSTPFNAQYFTSKLTNPHLDNIGLTSQTTPLGEAIVIDPDKIDGHSYFVLSDGDYDSACPEVEHLIQLIRLGSERSEQSCDPLVQPDIADSEFIYVNTPPEEEVSIHRHLTQFPTEDEKEELALTRSKSFTSSSRNYRNSMSPPTLSSPTSPSPYLITYSPRRDINLKTMPPDTPPEVEDPRQQTKPHPWNRWSFFKSKYEPSHHPSSAVVRDTYKAPPVVHQDQNERLNSCHDGESNGEELSTISSGHHPHHPPSNSEYKSDVQIHVEDRDTNSLTALSLKHTTSHNAPTNTNTSTGGSNATDIYGPNGHLAVSEGNLFHESVELSDSLKSIKSDHYVHKSPTLRGIRERLRSRLSSLNRKPQRSESSRGKASLTLPLLKPSPILGRKSVKSEVLVTNESTSGTTTTTTTEERYRPREGGRGSFVLIQVQDPGPDRFMDQAHLRRLENNFRLNHLFGNSTIEVKDSMRNITKQGKMYLQHLNFLSLAVQLDGCYSDVLLVAVRRYQVAHNEHESSFSSALLEDGHLNSVTFQYLRQAFLTVYASMLRLGVLGSLGENFDPTSTQEDDIAAFRKCLMRFQEFSCRQGYREGVLCSRTIAVISQNLVVESIHHTQDFII